MFGACARQLAADGIIMGMHVKNGKVLPEGPDELLAASEAPSAVADDDKGVGLFPDLAGIQLVDL